MAHLPSSNLSCPDKSAELYKRMAKKLRAAWTFLRKAFYFRYSYWEGLTIKYNGLQALAKHGLFMLYK